MSSQATHFGASGSKTFAHEMPRRCFSSPLREGYTGIFADRPLHHIVLMFHDSLLEVLLEVLGLDGDGLVIQDTQLTSVQVAGAGIHFSLLDCRLVDVDLSALVVPEG